MLPHQQPAPASRPIFGVPIACGWGRNGLPRPCPDWRADTASRRIVPGILTNWRGTGEGGRPSAAVAGPSQCLAAIRKLWRSVRFFSYLNLRRRRQV